MSQEVNEVNEVSQIQNTNKINNQFNNKKDTNNNDKNKNTTNELKHEKVELYNLDTDNEDEDGEEKKEVSRYDRHLSECNYQLKNLDNLEKCQYNSIINNQVHNQENNEENNEENNKSRIDYSKNICLVDLSYLTFTRFFGIRVWYSKAYDNSNYPDDYDWCKDRLFMEKFEKLFFKKLFEMCSKNDIPKTNIIFATDCRSSCNWRLELNNSYKETRIDSHKNNKFYNYDIFDFAKRALVKPLQDKYGNIVFKHKNLEADDLVALSIKYFREKKDFKNNIIILANDKDYVQICNDNTQLRNLQGKEVSKAILTDNNVSCQDYLLVKVLSGDPSDNIPACYLSKSILTKAGIKSTKDYLKGTDKRCYSLLSNPGAKQKLYDLLNYTRQVIMNKEITYNQQDINYMTKITKDNHFLNNLKIIDFYCIPEVHYKDVNDTILDKCFK